MSETTTPVKPPSLKLYTEYRNNDGKTVNVSPQCISVAEQISKILNQKRGQILHSQFFRKNGYEEAFCNFFEMTRDTRPGNKRYWDGIYGDIPIELKKSKESSYWLDFVRYCEMYLAKNGHTHGIKYPNLLKGKR